MGHNIRYGGFMGLCFLLKRLRRVVVIVSYGDAANGSSAYGVNALKTQAITGSNFQVCMSGGSGSGSREVHWIAIGT